MRHAPASGCGRSCSPLGRRELRAALAKVTASAGWPAYTSQWFAEQGFAVLAVDGRGTPRRGPAWERAIHLDLDRVGIRGWSFGGYLAALAVLRSPDVFHAAVAGAPVTDQRLYDTHWRERHLGRPEEHPRGYDDSSLVRMAASLRRPLLLVHGLADDNVVAAHTLRLSAALLAAGRPHEVLPPDARADQQVPVGARDVLTGQRQAVSTSAAEPG